MSKDEEELDPRETASHPRHRYELTGHQKAEHKLLEAYKSGRFHHAWMFCGPQGIGKATLAYRLARFILNHPDYKDPQVINASNLAIGKSNVVAHRIAARAHSDLFVLQRQLNPKTKKLRPEISADEARKLSQFYTKTAGEGGWRICIIDAADDLNTTSANAILKILEEPPQQCLFIIIAHAPGRLLPTIRSRCLRLDLAPLSNADVAKVVSHDLLDPQLSDQEVKALINLGNGSPGKVMQLVTSHGARQFVRFQQMLAAPQGFTLSAQISIAEEFQKAGSEIEFNVFADLLSAWFGNNAIIAGQHAMHERANALAVCHNEFSDSIRTTNALNLSRRQTLMMAFEKIEKILAHE